VVKVRDPANQSVGVFSFHEITFFHIKYKHFSAVCILRVRMVTPGKIDMGSGFWSVRGAPLSGRCLNGARCHASACAFAASRKMLMITRCELYVCYRRCRRIGSRANHDGCLPANCPLV
jgi:hypothetical protein